MGDAISIHLKSSTIFLCSRPFQGHVRSTLQTLSQIVKTVSGVRVVKLSLNFGQHSWIFFGDSAKEIPVIPANQAQAMQLMVESYRVDLTVLCGFTWLESVICAVLDEDIASSKL